MCQIHPSRLVPKPSSHNHSSTSTSTDSKSAHLPQRSGPSSSRDTVNAPATMKCALKWKSFLSSSCPRKRSTNIWRNSTISSQTFVLNKNRTRNGMIERSICTSFERWNCPTFPMKIGGPGSPTLATPTLQCPTIRSKQLAERTTCRTCFLVSKLRLKNKFMPQLQFLQTRLQLLQFLDEDAETTEDPHGDAATDNAADVEAMPTPEGQGNCLPTLTLTAHIARDLDMPPTIVTNVTRSRSRPPTSKIGVHLRGIQHLLLNTKRLKLRLATVLRILLMHNKVAAIPFVPAIESMTTKATRNGSTTPPAPNI